MRKFNVLFWLVNIFLTKPVKFLFRVFKKSFRAIHKKKRYAIPFYMLIGYVVLVVVLIKVSGDATFNKRLTDKRVNDVTQLNPIQVHKEIQPVAINEIVAAIRSTSGSISIGGGRYSMGGQIGYTNSLHLDMRKFNKVLNLDKEKKQVTVQSGITWRDLQKIIDKENLSIKIMQTYANFTVGGSISVNCHGRYIGHGTIISSVLALKLITANGDTLIASRSKNEELFKAAVGGYGGIGVIAEATLQLVDNVKVERQTKLVPVTQYKDFFDVNIRNDSNVIFQNGDLYPPNYDIVNNVSWKVSDKELTDTARVTPEGLNYWWESKLIEVVSWGNFGKWVRRKLIDPYLYKDEKVVWRNNEASYDVAELEPKSRKEETYVLQEYFIPVKNIEAFIPKMKAVYDKYDVNIINVSLRHAYPDKESYLSWAEEEVFAFVIYYKQGTDAEARDKVKQWTIEMTDAILSENGKWYLPYQPHATVEQFKQAFPNSTKYFEVKNRVDSLHRFNNKLLDKYNPNLKSRINKSGIKGFYRDEEQTILTVPEWYLVFNPKEYADFLEAGRNPSDFPFYASIDEYWKLYDRSKMLVSEAYPSNEEYNTMLKVIGVSVTMEYAAKILYENTVGAFFGWFANDSISEKEQTIIAAQRAYSDFIYHTAWYEFEFMPWIGKVWRSSESNGASWMRKWERTLFFTFEYAFKAAYAQLIEWAANASYEDPVTDIYVLASSEDTIATSKDIKLVKEEAGQKLLAITRWGAFTKAILKLSETDLVIDEIGGNDEIVVSVLSDSNQQLGFKNVEILYTSSLVTQNEINRYVCLVPVKDLLPFIRYAKEQSIAVEHVFDY
jgi:FAD/FMN-containing dehydrogenase